MNALTTASTFLNAVHGTFVSPDALIAIWTSPDKRTQFFDNVDDAASYSISRAPESNVYVGVGLYRPGIEHGRGKAVDVVGIGALWADIDYGPWRKKSGTPPDEAGAQQIVDSLPLRPSIMVHSGHGLQPWWLFTEPLLASDDAATLAQRWQITLQQYAGRLGFTVDSVGDLPRLMRVPGTVNRKDDPVPVRLLSEISNKSVRYDHYECEDACVDDASDSGRTSAVLAVTVDNLTLQPDAEPSAAKLQALMVNDPQFKHTWDKERPDLKDQSPSGYDLSLVNTAVAAGWNDQECADLIVGFRRRHGHATAKGSRADYVKGCITKARTLYEQNTADADVQASASEIVESIVTAKDLPRVNEPDNLQIFAKLPVAEWTPLKHQLKNAFGKSVNLNDLEKLVAEQRRALKRSQPTGLPDYGEDERPRLVVNGRPTDLISREAIEAMVNANNPPRIFVRGTELVRVDKDANGRPIIKTFNGEILRHELARVVHCLKATRDSYVHVPPPRELSGDILAAPSWPFPSLEGVTESPVLRPDGTILGDPGYDKATKLVYAPSPRLSLSPIPEEPSQENVRSALAVIEDVIADFPWDSEASHANMFGLLLTPIVRPYILGHVPMALLDAPNPGNGKGLLASVTTMIATGRNTGLTTAPRGEEEMRKKITSVLSQGATVITFDNVNVVLQHSSLSAVLTATVWSDRVLGKSEMGEYPQRATWLATGNNLCVKNDILRRCYRVRIDAKLARPGKRSEFRYLNLMEFVTEHRGELLVALLTMARGWIAAGKPDAGVRPIGSFEHWTTVIAGILHYAGVGGFLGNLDSMYDEIDEEAPQWEAFLSKGFELYGDQPFTVAGLVEHYLHQRTCLSDLLPDDLAEAMADPRSFRRRVGQTLRRRQDTRFGERNFRVERAGEDRKHKVALWRFAADKSEDALCDVEVSEHEPPNVLPVDNDDMACDRAPLPELGVTDGAKAGEQVGMA